MKNELTLQELKEYLFYDPETGIFTWIKQRGNRRVGEKAGTIFNGYSYLRFKKIRYLSHRLAWFYMTGKWPLEQIDHINGIKTDNRWQNLREATNSQNNMNKSINKKNNSGYKGVHFNKSHKKFRASIQKIHLGYFDNAEEASKVYEEAAKKMFGEFYRNEEVFNV